MILEVEGRMNGHSREDVALAVIPDDREPEIRSNRPMPGDEEVHAAADDERRIRECLPHVDRRTRLDAVSIEAWDVTGTRGEGRENPSSPSGRSSHSAAPSIPNREVISQPAAPPAVIPVFDDAFAMPAKRLMVVPWLHGWFGTLWAAAADAMNRKSTANRSE